MVPVDDIKRLLGDSLNVKVTNVPELEHAVVIVLDYSPTDSDRPASMAFSCSGEPKCWLTAEEVRKIDDAAPNRHPAYREFRFEGRRFYPYSIEALPSEVFGSASELESICCRMYKHLAGIQ